MTRPRNTQYQKFWTAQAVVIDISRPLKTERGLRSYVRKARERAFLTRRYGPQLRAAFHLTTEGECSVYRNSMRLPKSEWKEHAVARHLARLIWYRMQPYGSEEWAWHGPEFCAVYLDTVQALMGKPAADLLKNSFKANGVRFKPKKTVKVTDEMIERLAAARAKREKNNAEEA